MLKIPLQCHKKVRSYASQKFSAQFMLQKSFQFNVVRKLFYEQPTKATGPLGARIFAIKLTCHATHMNNIFFYYFLSFFSFKTNFRQGEKEKKWEKIHESWAKNKVTHRCSASRGKFSNFLCPAEPQIQWCTLYFIFLPTWNFGIQQGGNHAINNGHSFPKDIIMDYTVFHNRTHPIYQIVKKHNKIGSGEVVSP